MRQGPVPGGKVAMTGIGLEGGRAGPLASEGHFASGFGLHG